MSVKTRLMVATFIALLAGGAIAIRSRHARDRLVCRGSILIRSRGQTIEVSDPTRKGVASELCLPSIYFESADRICNESRVNPDFFDLDVYLLENGRTLISERGYCTKKHSGIEKLRAYFAKMGTSASRIEPFTDPELFTEPSSPTFMFRHSPRRDGLAENVLPVSLKEEWYREPLNVGIHGASKASPAVDASGIYVGSDSSWFYAYNPDGTLRWKFYFDHAQQGVHSTAALDRDHVYVGAYNGVLYCLNKSDGRLVWSIQLSQAIGSSPVLLGDSVWVAAETWKSHYDGFLSRVDRKTGRLIWRSQHLGAQSHSSAAIDEAGHQIFLGANNGKFFSFDLETGRTNWVFDDGDFIRSSPVFLPEFGAVYFSSYKDFVALDGKTGKPLWRVSIGGKSQSSPTYDRESDSFILATHAPGGVVSVARADGKLRWALPAPGVLLLGSATLAREAWISCSQDELCAVRPKDGSVARRIRLPGMLTGVPTIFGNSMYLAIDEGGLLKLSSAQ